MTTENEINNDNETIIKPDSDLWQQLYELAKSCINWGESDIDKECFFELGKQTFTLKLVE